MVKKWPIKGPYSSAKPTYINFDHIEVNTQNLFSIYFIKYIPFILH